FGSRVPEVDRVGGDDLPVELGVEVLQRGLVGGAARGDQVDLVAAVGAPEPEAVAEDRAAGLDTVVLDTVDVIARGEREARGGLSGPPRRAVGGFGRAGHGRAAGPT